METSEEFHFDYSSTKERFKLKYKVLYCFIDEEGNESQIQLKENYETFEQVPVNNPIIKLNKITKNLIKEQLALFNLEISNPNDFNISDVTVYIKPERPIELEIHEDGQEIKYFTFETLKPNEEIIKEISIKFYDKCKIHLEVNGYFRLSNFQHNKYKSEYKLEVNVYNSEEECNRIRSYTLL